MPIISTPLDYNEEHLYIDLRRTLGLGLHLKCEGFNFAGSVKLKAARAMVRAAEREGVIGPGSVLVESSSGNLGIALAIIAASRGYRFVCVTDRHCNETARRLMAAYGATVHVVDAPGRHGGLLGARLALLRELLAAHPEFVWLNQYTSRRNWQAHFETTAPALAAEFPRLDVLFVGAGTTGTLMGCARWFRQHRPGVRIVAVDSVGSVSFGRPPAPRRIPGLGAGVRPPLLDPAVVDEVVHVPEARTVRMCRQLAACGFLLGGSSGTVTAGAAEWLAARRSSGTTAVAIAPDLGERYLDTVYRDDWVRAVYGATALDAGPAAG
ncbi:2,3-diaminopropionate biosynthesis protein SbnA [Streptomyces sp. NPDC093589]|uniref:2,3-diaminopropionate biosynthesis protein SbnA n=1 Tax=Streptomyces sp. NPDC093589 TaxID=3366043 RepID=UPI003803C877